MSLISSSGTSGMTGLEPIIIGSSATIDSWYEILNDGPVSSLVLKKFSVFGLYTRTVGATSPEFGWTWANRTAIGSAGEYSSLSNTFLMTAANTTSDWYASYTCPFRYKSYSFGVSDLYSPKTIIARFSTNSTFNYSGICIGIVKNTDNAKFLRYGIGNGAGASNPKILSYVSLTPQETTCTSGNLTSGIWVKMTLLNGQVYFEYNTTVQTTPPTSGWVLDRTANFDLELPNTYKIGIMQIVNDTNTGMDTSTHYYNDEGLQSLDPSYDNPDWCAQGYAPSNIVNQIIVDFNMVSSSATISLTGLNSILANLTNSLYPTTTALWSFSAVQGPNPGESPGIFAYPPNVTCSGSGKYFSLWARALSDGFNPASLALPPIILPRAT